jgi:hypothetical protein
MITALVFIVAVAIAYFIGYKWGVKSITDRIEEAIWLAGWEQKIIANEEAIERARLTTNEFRKHHGLEPIPADEVKKRQSAWHRAFVEPYND